MKKIMVAALGLTLLSGTVVFAQNTSTSTGSTDTMSSGKHHKKKKGKTSTDTMSSTMGSTK